MNTERFFIDHAQAEAIDALAGTPVYVYSAARLEAQVKAALAFPNAYGLTVRFAMKACPNAAILKLFDGLGLHIDASSGWEVRRALRAGVAPKKISLSTQELPADFAELVNAGILVNACSLSQLERYGQAFPGTAVGVRFNPGLGSGGTGKTNVGGPSSSFGIWHEQAEQVLETLAKYNLRCVRLHSHIGSGSDPAVWLRVVGLNLDLVKKFPQVETLNLGGGYKVARTQEEKGTDLQTIGTPMKAEFEAFAQSTGRKLKLEIEPGTFLVANAGALLSKVQDIVDTGAEGRRFIKLDAGMTELLRPSLYAAQHPITLLPKTDPGACERYVVVGHCCESGDLMTPAPDDPEALSERELPRASIGDYCLIGGTGAYCAAMSTKNYNSFPEAPEVLIETTGEPRLIRKRQTLEQMLANEV